MRGIVKSAGLASILGVLSYLAADWICYALHVTTMHATGIHDGKLWMANMTFPLVPLCAAGVASVGTAVLLSRGQDRRQQIQHLVAALVVYIAAMVLVLRLYAFSPLFHDIASDREPGWLLGTPPAGDASSTAPAGASPTTPSAAP
jgi:hypothetical protein